MYVRIKLWLLLSMLLLEKFTYIAIALQTYREQTKKHVSISFTSKKIFSNFKVCTWPSTQFLHGDNQEVTNLNLKICHFKGHRSCILTRWYTIGSFGGKLSFKVLPTLKSKTTTIYNTKCLSVRPSIWSLRSL